VEGCLDSGTCRETVYRVHGAHQLVSREDFLHDLLDDWNPRPIADQLDRVKSDAFILLLKNRIGLLDNRSKLL